MPPIHKKNKYRIEEIDGVECVVFQTNGKFERDVIVDKDLWFKYLIDYSWTVQNKHREGRLEVKTSINGVLVYLHRLIVERELGELFTYNRSIDHGNNNTFDNRLCNLEPVCQRLNSNNNKSKSNNIYQQYTRKDGTCDYKVHATIDGKAYVEIFSTYEEAKEYSNNVINPLRKSEMEKIKKKDRDIEFERGLVSKLENNELDEVLSILKKYNIDAIARLSKEA